MQGSIEQNTFRESRMKILWFTNIPMPDVNEHFGKEALGTGGWMGALLERMREQPGLQMGVVTACGHFPDAHFRKNSVDYFIINQRFTKFRRTVFPVDNNPVYLKKCAEIVRDFKPDIIHVHGTERFYGQLLTQGLVSCPVVFSIQGILDACSQWYRFFGTMPLREIVASSFLDSLKGSGLLWDFREIQRQAAREREYFKKGRYFFGRTAWDKAYVRTSNPKARYFTAGEILRQPFWEKQWTIEGCRKHRIIFTNTRHSRKGAEVLLDGVERLRPRYPDIELILIGSLGSGGYASKLRKRIDYLKGTVIPLGSMGAKQISAQLCKAHLFVSASYIDNSPNSIAEAQLVGMPVISSYTGGVPSMITEGETGLFFPTGDVPNLVSRIEEIFNNEDFARRLGRQAREVAVKRHDPETIVKAQFDAYNCILSEGREKKHA